MSINPLIPSLYVSLPSSQLRRRIFLGIGGTGAGTAASGDWWWHGGGRCAASTAPDTTSLGITGSDLSAKPKQ